LLGSFSAPKWFHGALHSPQLFPPGCRGGLYCRLWRHCLNSAANGNHWLLIQATGRKSNRDAIGTKIKVTTPSGRTLYNHVTVSVGFLSSSDPRVHFGLGSEKMASSIEIRWPSGAVQTLTNVAADRILKVVEPQ